MLTTTPSPYTLTRVNDLEWVIRDRRYDPDDVRHTVARVWEVDENECEVSWLRDFALPTTYASAAAVLDDLRIGRRRTKPITIPHFPPFRSADDLRGAAARVPVLQP